MRKCGDDGRNIGMFRNIEVVTALAAKGLKQHGYAHSTNVESDNQLAIHLSQPVIVVRFRQSIRQMLSEFMRDNRQTGKGRTKRLNLEIGWVPKKQGKPLI